MAKQSLRLRLKRFVRDLLLSPYFPSRKAIATGCSGIIAYYLVLFFNASPDVAAAIVAAVTTIVSYVVPQSLKDLVRTSDLVITDVTGRVTDLMWKFDREKGEMRRYITKGNKHVDTPVKLDKIDKPKSVDCSKLRDSPSVECKCNLAQGDDELRAEAADTDSKPNS